MKNEKTKSKSYDIQKKIRRAWDIKPVTRIKQDERRDTKKRRQKNKNEIKRFNIDEIN